MPDRTDKTDNDEFGGLRIGYADFGAIVRVTDGKRHNNVAYPQAMVTLVQKMSGGYRVKSAIFMNAARTKFGFAHLYDDEHGEIIERLSEEDAIALLEKAEAQ